MAFQSMRLNQSTFEVEALEGQLDGSLDIAGNISLTGEHPKATFKTNSANGDAQIHFQGSDGIDLANIRIDNTGTTLNHFSLNAGTNETDLCLDASGNVGIGTGSPGALLELNAEHPKLLLRSNSANGDPQVVFQSGDGSTMANMRCDVTSNVMNYFSINGATGTDHLVIASDGKVGVGTIPTELFHIKSSVSYKPELLIENANDDAIHSVLRFYKSTTDEAAGDDIGAIFFTGKDAANSNADMAWILGAGSTVDAGAEEGVIHMGVASAGAAATASLSIVGQGTANTTYVYLGDPASGGTTSLGINTVAPGADLEINAEHPQLLLRSSSANGDGTIKFKSLDGTQLANIRCDTTSNALNHLGISAGTGEDHLVVHSSGNVGINDISPSHTLDVDGDINLTGGFSFDDGTAVTSIDADISSVSGSDDTLASAKAIKTYVDAVATASDLDFQGDSGGALSIDLDSETLTIAGTSNEIETVGSGNTLTIGLPNDVTIGSDLAVTDSLVVDTSTLVVNASGYTDKVGIGTATPGADLEINNEHPKLLLRSNSANGDPQVLFKSGDGTQLANIRVGASSNAVENVSISTGSNDNHLVVHSSGRVGIGDTVPGTALQVSAADAYLTLKNTTAENGEGGAETKIIFEDHADVSLGQFEVSHSGTADDTKGKMIFSTHTGSALTAAITINDEQMVTMSGDLDITSTRDATDATGDTGALRVEGGASIAQSVYLGSILSVAGDTQFLGDTATFSSANSQDPLVIIKNTTNDANGARLQFVKDKGAAGADGDDIGVIEFVGDDAGQTQTTFAKILAEVSEADNTDEAGKLSFMVAESDGTTTTLTAGLVLEGEHATDGEVDVTIGAGVASTTTVVGTSQFNADATFGVDDTGVDVRLFSATASEGVLYDASEDELALLLTTKLKFHDVGGGEEIFASADGHLEINAETTLDITAPTVDINASTKVNIDGVVDITDTTDATDATGDTGALRCEGGASIAKKLYVGTDLDVDGTSNLDAVDIDGIVDINPGTSAGSPALRVVSSDVDQVGFKVESTNTTAHAVSINCDDSLTTGNALHIDHNDAATSAVNPKTVHIDFDKDGVTGDGVTSGYTLMDLEMNDGATNHANATVQMVGLDLDITSANAQGACNNYGILVDVSGGDVNVAANFTGDTASQTAVSIRNSGNNANRYGLLIQAGTNSISGTPGSNVYAILQSGNGSATNGIIVNSGASDGNVAFAASSDERLKRDIVPTKVVGLDVLNKIEMSEFRWKKDGSDGPLTKVGFVAQNCEEVYPEMVAETGADLWSQHGELNHDVKTVSPSELIPVMVKAIQELSASNKALVSKIEELEQKLS